MEVIIKTGKNVAGAGKSIKREIGGLLRKYSARQTDDVARANLAIIIGGDGTFLYWQSRLSCPVYGIKTGGVGYYMGASADDFSGKLGEILNGMNNGCQQSNLLARMVAELNGRVFPLALNEYLISSGHVRQMFNCKLTVRGKETVERNSGIIVYTPTGSNAFASAAGAESLKINDRKMGIVALAPYSGRLKKKGIFFDKDEVKIECLNDFGEICVDGQKKYTYKIMAGDAVIIKKSVDNLKVVGILPGLPTKTS